MAKIVKSKQQRNRRIVIILLIFVVLMFFFGYALVPLYNALCDALGINGKTGGVAVVNTQVIDKSRVVTVQFIANRNANLRWEFRPLTKSVELHPGEDIKLAYYAKNDTNQTMTVQAVPSVTPGVAAKYLQKTECFCFNQQTLGAHESMKMPLLFHIDNSLPKNIHEITLSYTLFKATKQRRKGEAGRLLSAVVNEHSIFARMLSPDIEGLDRLYYRGKLSGKLSGNLS